MHPNDPLASTSALPVLVALTLLAVPLAGCVGSGGQGGDTTPVDGGNATPDTPDNGTDAAPTTRLGFEGDGSVLTDNRTVTVGPQDACLPVACNTHIVTGNGNFIEFIDISDLAPAGTHAWVEVEATWDETVSATVFSEMNLQWWFQDMWVSGADGGTEPGRAWLEGYLTSHGPEPARIILVVIEPENVQSIDVDVSLRVEPLTDRVAPWHPVGVPLDGPTTVRAEVNGTLDNGTLQVRGPDDALVAQAPFEDGAAAAEVPDGSPAGEYTLHVQGTGDPVSFHVPETDLDAPVMRLLDISPEAGQTRTPPSGGEEVTWSVELDRAPYWVAVWTQQLDRWALLDDMNVTITGPDGDVIVQGGVAQGPGSLCICGYSVFVFGTTPGAESLTAGTYTFTVSTGVNAEYDVWEVVGTYR